MIHPTAIIDPSAELAANVTVGPYSVIGAGVQIDEECVIGPHVVINGPTRIGRKNHIFQFASIGDDPQDKKYGGETTRLEIGDGNTIREYVTINRGTEQGGGITRIGDDNWIMAYVHVAHDCQVGNHIVFANSTNLAGHVTIEDHAILGGATLVHQFCSIGAYSFCAKGTGISQDVPPFIMVAGHFGQPNGLNSEGLRRHGFSAESIKSLKKAYKILYRSGATLKQALEELDRMSEQPEIRRLIDFVGRSERGIVR